MVQRSIVSAQVTQRGHSDPSFRSLAVHRTCCRGSSARGRREGARSESRVRLIFNTAPSGTDLHQLLKFGVDLSMAAWQTLLWLVWCKFRWEAYDAEAVIFRGDVGVV